MNKWEADHPELDWEAMGPFRLWQITNCECGGRDCELRSCTWSYVWAPTVEMAIEYGIDRRERDDLRHKEILGVEPEKNTVHHECRDEVLRELHCYIPGDSSCDTCGLYEMGGKFPVCEECRQCNECGCDCAITQ